MQFDFSQQPGLAVWNRDLVKTERPLVSIITPFYNDSKHIQQTCNSVLNQTFPYFEWIIVNDGSTEYGVTELLAKIADMDPRIRVLSKQNEGPSATRNYGIRNARAELILPLDADDLLEPTFIEYCWWMLEKNPTATWAYTDSVGFDGMEYLWNKRFDPVLLKTENHLTITAIIRKEAFLSIGCYSEEYKRFNEDWHAWLKLVAKGCFPAQSTGEYLFWYRRSDTGVLANVLTHKENADINRKIISKAAKQVKHPHSPIIYPQKSRFNWAEPHLSNWSQSVYQNKSKKHILFLFPHLVMGGADKFNFDLIYGLDKKKFDTGIITTIPSPNDWLQSFRKAASNIFNLPNFVAPEDYAEFISYYIKSRSVDILFVSNSFHGYYLIPWLRENFPNLVIVDYVHMEEWYWRNGGYARASAMIGPFTEKTYVCNSATEDVLVSHYGRLRESVQTVHIGVDPEYFDPTLVEEGTLYQELGISRERPIVLFICRIHPQKRPFLMLEIAQNVSKQIPEVAFAVIGNGPQEAELREKAQTLSLNNTVYFLGARRDVRPYYRDAKITLVCSLKEGLSLTAYESCAMGVPVVSADVGGQKDLVDGLVGALIPCRQTETDCFDARTFEKSEVEEYVQAIIKLLEDQTSWKTASQNCRDKIINGFTIRNMVEYFQEEFCCLLSDEKAMQQRHLSAQTLQLCGPLAAELYTLEMQVQHTENELDELIKGNHGAGKNLLLKARRVIKQEGVMIFIRKVLRFVKRRFLAM